MPNGWRKKKRVVKRVLADGSVREYRYDAYKRTQIPADSVSGLVAAYRSSPKWRTLSPNSQATYARHLVHIEEAMGDRPAKSILRRDILALRDVIATQRGNGSAGNFIAAAGSLFYWGLNNDWIDRTPVDRIERLPGGALPAWTEEQAGLALSHLPDYLRRAVILGLYTGQRRSDLCAVRWSAYTGHEIKFTQQKTGAVVVLAVHPELRAELDSWPRTAVTILANYRGIPWTPTSLSVQMQRGLKRIGLPPGLNVHGLRKLFATSIADAGGSTHQIAAGTGHRTLGMVAHYTRSADQRRLGGEAVAMLPRFGKK